MRFTAHEYSLYSYYRFRFHVRDHREVALSMLAVLCNSGSLEGGQGVPSARQVTTALGGLARMGMKWGLLPQSEKSHPGLGLLPPATHALKSQDDKDKGGGDGDLQDALIEVSYFIFRGYFSKWSKSDRTQSESL